MTPAGNCTTGPMPTTTSCSRPTEPGTADTETARRARRRGLHAAGDRDAAELHDPPPEHDCTPPAQAGHAAELHDAAGGLHAAGNRDAAELHDAAGGLHAAGNRNTAELHDGDGRGAAARRPAASPSAAPRVCSAPSGAQAPSAHAYITGSQIKRVTFYVNGRKVKTLTKVNDGKRVPAELRREGSARRGLQGPRACRVQAGQQDVCEDVQAAVQPLRAARRPAAASPAERGNETSGAGAIARP